MTHLPRHFVSPAIAMLSLSTIVIPAPVMAATYAQSMARVQSYVRANQIAEAESALQVVDRRFPNNPEVRAQLMRLACRREAFELGNSYRLPASKNTELQDAVTYCATEQQYATAHALMQQGLPAQAIDMLKPLMQQEKEGYRAGLLLAQAYLANHQPDSAEALYLEMARRYPADAIALQKQAERLRNDRELITPQDSLARGDLSAAINEAAALYASGHDRYRSGLLLAKAYIAQHQFDAAASTYRSLANLYPADQDLPKLAAQASEMHALSVAKNLLDRGNNAEAVAYLAPIYPTLTDRYQGGLLLIQGYRALGVKTKVAELTSALARDYPADTSLPPMAVMADLADAQQDAASARYASLSTPQQVQVLTALGGNGDRLSRRSITLVGAIGNSDAGRGSDQAGGIRLRLTSRIGALTASTTRAHRFGQYASEYGIGYGTDLGGGTTGEIAYTRSPNGTFLARQSFSLALSHRLTVVDLYASVRHLIYTNSVADVLYAGIGKQLTATAALRTGLFYVPQTSAYSLLIGGDWIDANGDKLFATATAGRAGEQTGFRDSVIRTAGYSLLLGKLTNLPNQTAFQTSVSYEHRAGLFNRLGLNVDLTKGW